MTITLSTVSVVSVPREVIFPCAAVCKVPVTFPSRFATRVPVVIVRLPVEVDVAVVVQTIKLSALSSQTKIALSPVEPLSITSPESLLFAPDNPVLTSIRCAETVSVSES